MAIQNVIDLTRAVRQLIAEGYPVKREDLAALSPCQTRHIKRFGDYVLTVTATEPFDGDQSTRFPLEVRVRGAVRRHGLTLWPSLHVSRLHPK